MAAIININTGVITNTPYNNQADLIAYLGAESVNYRFLTPDEIALVNSGVPTMLVNGVLVEDTKTLKKNQVTAALTTRNNVFDYTSNTMLIDSLMVTAGMLKEALDFAVNGTEIVMILTDGSIYYSADSTTFTKETTINFATKVKYANNKWYIMTRTGILYTSTDGITFTQLVTAVAGLAVKANRDANKIAVFNAANSTYYTNTNIAQPTTITA